MKATENSFHVVEMDDEMHLYDSEDQAVTHLRESAANVDPETDDVTVSNVSVDGEDWTIKQLPWQEIALRLLREE